MAPNRTEKDGDVFSLQGAQPQMWAGVLLAVLTFSPLGPMSPWGPLMPRPP